MFDEREAATLLAALRLWQRELLRNNVQGGEIYEIATNGEKVEPLDGDEIDDLCDRINKGEE